MADEPPTRRGRGGQRAGAHPRGVIAEAVRLLSAQGIGMDDINLRRPTLDDVFLSLTGHAAEEPAEAEEEEPR